MAMSNGVTGGNFTTLADLQASKPRAGTVVTITNNGLRDVYSIDSLDGGGGISVNGLFANKVLKKEVFNASKEGFDNIYYNPTLSVSLKNIYLGSDTPLDGHRHFGGITRTLTGRLIVVHRRAPEHALTANTSITYEYSDDGGVSWSSETTLIASEALYDNRECSICTTDTGRVVVNYGRITADSSGNNQFKSLYSDDNGATWSAPTVYDTIVDTFSRTFGQMKVVPSDDPLFETMIISPAYMKIGSNFDVAYYRSYDNGATFGDKVTVESSVTGYNETSLCWVNSETICAVARSNTGLTLFTSTNAGASWVNGGVIPLAATSSQVAPSLNLVTFESRQYIMLGYCDRGSDKTTWRIDEVQNIFNVSPVDLFGNVIHLGIDDMVNASGYQSGVFFDDSTFVYLEFKEFNGDAWSDVRFGVAYPNQFIPRSRPNSYKLGISAKHTAVDAILNGQIESDSTPMSASNAGTTSDRLHNALLVLDLLVGGLGTSAQGTSLLDNNKVAQFEIDNARSGKPFANLGCNFGVIDDAERTGKVNTSVDGSSTPAHTTSTGSTSSRKHYSFRNPNGEVGSIATSGTATAFNISSDPRLKTEFKGVDDSEIASIISALAGTIGKYQFKSDLTHDVIGFDAHKVADIDGFGSEIATEGKGSREASLSDEGVTSASVDYSKAVPYLIKAVNYLLNK